MIDQGLAIILSASIAIIGYAVQSYFSQQRDLESKRYQGKQNQYEMMLKKLSGFFEGENKQQLMEEFLNEFNIAYLYASEETINKINIFLDIQEKTETEISQEKRKEALGEVMLSMRKDLGLKSKLLKPSDFKPRKVNATKSRS